jgi:predicted Ser/Thr protein kinase
MPDEEQSTVLTPAPGPGVLVKNRYRIERELARGGFGVVYLARDEQLSSKPVVIKVLLEQSEHADWFAKKFRDEREALARLDHPGVVGVLDCGEMPDGKPYLVMQFVDGITLRTALGPQGLPLDRTARLVRQIAQALGAAHERGVYHRDLKPENIMLQDLGRGEELVKIIDFGIATVKESAAAVTQVTRVAGSGSYMSPEHLMGKPSDRSDTYSLAVIAYEMLTGRRPFEPQSAIQLYWLQQQGVKLKPSELRPDVPAAAEQVILKALSFDPNERYARVRDFGEELARALMSSPSEAAPGSVVSSPAPEADNVGKRKGAFGRRRTAIAASLLVVAAAIVAIGWYWAAARRPGSLRPPPLAPERALTYSILVQKYRGAKPFGHPFRLAGEINFEQDYRIRLVFSGSQSGRLYVLNEGPADSSGLATLNVLFPGLAESSLVAANQKIQIPSGDAWMRFDEQQGTETLLVVWSREPAPELEAARVFTTPEYGGAIRDAARLRVIRAFLNEHRTVPVTKEKGPDATQIRGRGNVIVSALPLEHH